MRTLAALSLAALTAGCKLTNDTVLVAMLVQSPAPPMGLGGSQISTAQVYLGQTSVTGPTAGDVSPISGATVKLIRTAIGGGTTEFVLPETQPGYYQASGNFYQATATFRFSARVGSDEYWGEVANAPSAPALTLPGTAVGDVYTYPSYSVDIPSPYEIGRAPCNGLCDVAFYGVWSVPGSTFDGSATPNCTNAPQDAAALLNFAFLDDTAWRVNPFPAVKATCFPVAGSGTYVVGLTALKKGSTSGNTSIASAVLVGTSDAAGVIVSGP